MLERPREQRLSFLSVLSGSTWAVVDQAIVSLGIFLTGVILARNLPPRAIWYFRASAHVDFLRASDCR
jgi:hypothetical protein